MARAAAFMTFEGRGHSLLKCPSCGSCGSFFSETVWRYYFPADSSGTGLWVHLRADRAWWSVVCLPVVAWMASPTFFGDAAAGYLCSCPCPQGLRPMRLCPPFLAPLPPVGPRWAERGCARSSRRRPPAPLFSSGCSMKHVSRRRPYSSQSVQNVSFFGPPLSLFWMAFTCAPSSTHCSSPSRHYSVSVSQVQVLPCGGSSLRSVPDFRHLFCFGLSVGLAFDWQS